MFCTKCGLKIPDNIKFCPKCGNRVLGNGMAGENLHNTAKAAGEQRQPVRQRQREETRHKRSKASKGKKKATLGLLCAVCCVAGLMLIIRNESKIDALFKEEEPKQEENVEAGDNTSVLHQYDESYNAKNMVDMAGVLSVSEEKELSEYMEKIKNVQKYELAAVIIPHDELGGKTAEEYSETYYLQNDIGVVLINRVYCSLPHWMMRGMEMRMFTLMEKQCQKSPMSILIISSGMKWYHA